MRCERTDTSYSAIISFACGLMLVKSVHTAAYPSEGAPWELPDGYRSVP
jgi:hypothetical protein